MCKGSWWGVELLLPSVCVRVFRNVPLHIRNIGAQCRTLSRLVAQIKLVSRLYAYTPAASGFRATVGLAARFQLEDYVEASSAAAGSNGTAASSGCSLVERCIPRRPRVSAIFFFSSFERKKKTGNEARHQPK